MAALNEITFPQSLRLIGLPDAPAVVDVSIDNDFAADPFLIPGAFRHPHTEARVLFVSPAEVESVAARHGATAFDVEGVFRSHRGDKCTFDTLLEEFGLHSAALARMATVIRAADTNRHDLSPQAAGLLALSVGLSRQFKDDLAQLEARLALYDALYRWARDGVDEGHDWPAGAGA